MTVPLSESDIAKIKVGQAATVTPEALTGVQLAAKVSSISDMGTSSSGVVSYDVTLTVEQAGAHVRPGMSASAAIVTARARGINLPNDAVPGTASLATVQVVKNGGTSSQQVVVGLRGDSRTLIVSGLSAGQQVRVTTTLPALGTSSAGTSSGSSGTLGGGAGTGGFAARALGGGFAGGGLRGGAGVRGGGG
jgi:macrolide-specific efflux system membrane fusion protein